MEQVVADAGGAASVVSAMQGHGGSAAVQEQGCRALTNLMFGSDARKQAVADAGGAASIVSAMRSHRGSLAVQEEGCRALATLVRGSNARQQVVVDAGGVDSIVSAMQSHGGSAAVQEEGCRALATLVRGSNARQQVVVDAGGVDSIVSAMQSHGGSAAVQEEGCAALTNLMNGSNARQQAVADTLAAATKLSLTPPPPYSTPLPPGWTHDEANRAYVDGRTGTHFVPPNTVQVRVQRGSVPLDGSGVILINPYQEDKCEASLLFSHSGRLCAFCPSFLVVMQVFSFA